MREKLVAAFGSVGTSIYNSLYVVIVILPILALPIRWWWKIALFASIFIPLLGGYILYILEFVSLTIVLKSTQNWFAIIYYLQFVFFLIFVFIPFLMAVLASILHKSKK